MSLGSDSHPDLILSSSMHTQVYILRVNQTTSSVYEGTDLSCPHEIGTMMGEEGVRQATVIANGTATSISYPI